MLANLVMQVDPVINWIGIFLAGVLSGIVGGLVVAALGIFAERAKAGQRAKVDDIRSRRDTLVNILGNVIPYVDNGVKNNWDIPDETSEETRVHRRDCYNQVSQAIGVFWDNEHLRAVIFATLGAIISYASEFDELAANEGSSTSLPAFINYKVLSNTLPYIKAAIRNEISVLEQELYS